jgi:hypothetical protein
VSRPRSNSGRTDFVAISNRDRIGKMFELVAPALDGFIARSVAPQLPEGADWAGLVAMKDKRGGSRARSITASILRCSCGCSPKTSRTT